MRCFSSHLLTGKILRREPKRMKLQHAATVALVGWCLMRAPLLLLRVSHNAQAIHADTAAPLSWWITVETFPTLKECDAHRGAIPWEQCVATDDPRLKQK